MKPSSPRVNIQVARNGVEAPAPIVIAGPCSAESEEQILSTALALDAIPQVTVFRAGIWKPRTRPNGFEGIGAPALEWLKRVQKETRLKTIVEVGNSNHVHEALKYGVDMLWIGARTTVNPFSVQEIADALRGADIPVWVKNPMHPDLGLWLGALERLNGAGISQLGAVHRGFSTSESSTYRNVPRWELPLELKRQIPDIPILCDPSHIGGSREYIYDLSQQALDFALDGLMIECHNQPDLALSDKDQQISPQSLIEVLDRLVHRREFGDDTTDKHMLAVLRKEIDAVDNELIKVISQRNAVVERIGRYKRDHNMTIFQVNRWERVLEDRRKQSEGAGLQSDYVEKIFRVLHQYSIHAQSRLLNEKN